MAPLNTLAPAVTGTATNGQTLSCSTGTWAGSVPITYTYQWKRGVTNVGTNSSTYVLVDADVGSAMSCVVTGTNSVGNSSGTSNSTSAVAALVPGAPIIGTATVTGATTATISFTAPASNGGATITTYTAYPSSGAGTGTLSQAGSGTISVTGLTGGTAYTFTVKATNSAGQSAASGSSNSITTYAAPVNTVLPAITGTVVAGNTLTSSTGTWTGAPTPTYAYQWQHGTTNISAATSSTWVVSSSYLNETVRVVVTATNSAGAVNATSSNTGVISMVPAAPTSFCSMPVNDVCAVQYWCTAVTGACLFDLYYGPSAGVTTSCTKICNVTNGNTVCGLPPGCTMYYAVLACNTIAGPGALSSECAATTCSYASYLYQNPGSYTFTVPAGVTCLSAVAVGGGGSRSCDFWTGSNQSGGGALAYINGVAVSGGQNYTVYVGCPGLASYCAPGQNTWFINQACLLACGGRCSASSWVGLGGGCGMSTSSNGGPGGAGGYGGVPGNTSGVCGGSGGAGWGEVATNQGAYSGGGGTGLCGQGADGCYGIGVTCNYYNGCSCNSVVCMCLRGGGGGSSGQVGGWAYASMCNGSGNLMQGGSGGWPGGGGGGWGMLCSMCNGGAGAYGSGGAVRIVFWSGSCRGFPCCNVGSGLERVF